MPLFKTSLKLLGCKRGNALIVVAGVMPLLVGAAAVGVDTVQVTLAQRTLQRMADSAAIAGTYGVARRGTGNINTARTAAVTRDLALNNNIQLSEPAQAAQPTTGDFATDTNAVRVVLTASRSVPFMSYFGRGDMIVRAEATATLVASGRYCVITLARNGTGVQFAGSTTANLGCGIASNSTDAAAIAFDGNSAIVTASPVAAPGGVPPATSFAGTTTTLPGSLPVANPYSHIEDPIYPDPDANPAHEPSCRAAVEIAPNQEATLDPACYTGLTLKGEVTFNPGIYYIGSGGLNITSQATVTGNGVAFVFLQNSGPASINGGGAINLTAPTEGIYTGILIHRHSLAPAVTNTFSGNSATVLDGAIYMPNQMVTLTGDSNWAATCLKIVSDRATFTGSSVLMNSCPRPDDRGMIAGFVARLVG